MRPTAPFGLQVQTAPPNARESPVTGLTLAPCDSRSMAFGPHPRATSKTQAAWVLLTLALHCRLPQAKPDAWFPSRGDSLGLTAKRCEARLCKAKARGSGELSAKLRSASCSTSPRKALVFCPSSARGPGENAQSVGDTANLPPRIREEAHLCRRSTKSKRPSEPADRGSGLLQPEPTLATRLEL